MNNNNWDAFYGVEDFNQQPDSVIFTHCLFLMTRWGAQWGSEMKSDSWFES